MKSYANDIDHDIEKDCHTIQCPDAITIFAKHKELR